jgi:hypothetical protein
VVSSIEIPLPAALDGPEPSEGEPRDPAGDCGPWAA